jgi:hypothetical protein
MAPLVGLIASMFAKEGMNLLAGAVKGGGEKAVEFIEQKTGIDIKDVADPNTETQLTPEHIEKLKALESSSTLDLARIVAGASADKAGGIILAAIAPEVPEMILFGMGLLLVLGFAVGGKVDAAINIASTWLGAFAMYVKGK